MSTKIVIMEMQEPVAGLTRKRPARELQRLKVFLGKWKVFGKNLPGPSEADEVVIHGEDNFAWLAGDHYIVGSWQHLYLGGGHIGLLVIGYDDQEKMFYARKFDNLGYDTKYIIEPAGDSWKFTGSRDRCTRVFNHSGTSYTEHWERKDGSGKWVSFCILNGIRI